MSAAVLDEASSEKAEASSLEEEHTSLRRDPISAQSSSGSENDSETEKSLSNLVNHDSEAEFKKAKSFRASCA